MRRLIIDVGHDLNGHEFNFIDENEYDKTSRKGLVSLEDQRRRFHLSLMDRADNS